VLSVVHAIHYCKAFKKHLYSRFLKKTCMTEFIWQGALVMGAAIGLVELFFVHADERGLGWLSHGLHALPTAMIFTFFAMNVDFLLNLVHLADKVNSNIWLEAGIRVILGLIAAFKVKAAAAVIQGHNSVGEKLGHALTVGALIAASPYIWVYIAPQLPAWLSGLPNLTRNSFCKDLTE
jgi:hypothetical protein